MSLPSVPFARRAVLPAAKLSADRRRHKRVPLTLLGRFMRANKLEYPCKLNDISVGGASMMSPVQLRPDERIIAYFDHIGGIEGTVARVFDGGFAMKLIATPHKREKLAAQLTWLINRHEIPSIDARRHERIATPPRSMPLKLDDGLTIECRVLDFSLSGAAVETTARPRLGTEVILGKLRARVIRHHETGLGLQFLDVQQPEALRRYFG
jgi:hypothetical protein